MGHVSGYATGTQTRLYVVYAHANAFPPANYAALNAVIADAMEMPDCSEIGDLAEEADIRTFTIFGAKRKSRVAGPAAPPNFSFTVTTDFSKVAHQTLAGKGSGDLIAFAIVLTDADEDDFGDPENAEVWYCEGTVAAVTRINSAGTQAGLMCEVAVSRGPAYLSN